MIDRKSFQRMHIADVQWMVRWEVENVLDWKIDHVPVTSVRILSAVPV